MDAGPMDAVATGGAGGQAGDGASLDHPVDRGDGGPAGGSAGGPSSSGGGTGTGGGQGGGAAGAGGGAAAGGNTNDAGPPDLPPSLPPSDGGMAQGGAGGSLPGDGAAGGAGMDGGSADVLFPCGPCSTLWICGGYADAAETDVVLTPEDDGCYLAGLSGHVLLSPDGTVTENGVPIARAQKFGPQVGFYWPDGGQWFYCGGNLPCPGQ